MSVITIGIEDPEYYPELLWKSTRPPCRSLPPNERPCPDVPGVQDLDDLLSRRLQALLDILADISLCQRNNVSATMASLKVVEDRLETRLYIIFNHGEDETARHCRQHLEDIFKLLSKITCNTPPTDGSLTDLSDTFKDDIIEVYRAIHNYSFERFAHRVNKHKDDLSKIRAYIEQDQTHFNPVQRTVLLTFLEHVDAIITIVGRAQNTKALGDQGIGVLRACYAYWTKNNLLPRDPSTDNQMTLLDIADTLLADHKIGFQLRRWALKIMSFVISANRLFMLTQSRCLHNVFLGKFFVIVLPSRATTPIRCDVSPETMRGALDAALTENGYEPAEELQDMARSFIEWVRKSLNDQVVHEKPRVHAELAMIMAMVKDEIKDVSPNIGVSKLSCIMCAHYIETFKKVTKRTIATRGTHGKAYAGWMWPSLPGYDEKLRPAFMKAIREQLVRDFEQFVEWERFRRYSDSSAGSDIPGVEANPTANEIREMVALAVLE